MAYFHTWQNQIQTEKYKQNNVKIENWSLMTQKCVDRNANNLLLHVLLYKAQKIR